MCNLQHIVDMCDDGQGVGGWGGGGEEIIDSEEEIGVEEKGKKMNGKGPSDSVPYFLSRITGADCA